MMQRNISYDNRRYVLLSIYTTSNLQCGFGTSEGGLRLHQIRDLLRPWSAEFCFVFHKMQYAQNPALTGQGHY